ncbi:hypothetical protein EWM64_g3152 [Hericium alpestre]|uniref:Uncharacterized protein n=1 Tax=Hericium alpestre TaxID=135208 RepID=A0A4Z0A3P5_9AGAM|nr:hypothetical protein EWM64_g3152 [Hericium alpestre]
MNHTNSTQYSDPQYQIDTFPDDPASPIIETINHVLKPLHQPLQPAPPAAPTLEPSSSSAKAKGKGRGKGKKRARDDDSDAAASSAKRSRHAEPETFIALETTSSITPAENSPTAPEAESSTAPDVASAAAAAATIERSPTPENRVRCRWGGCGKLIGKKADVLGLHLRRAHLNKKPEEDAEIAEIAKKGKKVKNAKNAEKLACIWDGGCGAEPMGKSSMERHVTATHLSLQAHTCPRCQKKLCRGDATKRHMEKCSKCEKCGVQYDSVEDLDDHACPGSDAGSSGEK